MTSAAALATPNAPGSLKPIVGHGTDHIGSSAPRVSPGPVGLPTLSVTLKRTVKCVIGV